MSKGRKTNYVTQQQLNTLRGGKGIGHIHTNKETLDMILFDEENNAVYLGSPDNKINFYVFGELTAGGIGSDSGGGGGTVASIKVGTLPYLPDDDGVVTLPDYYGKSYIDSALAGKQASLGTGTEGQILKWTNGAPAWGAAPASGVTSVAGLTGEVSKSALQSALELGSLAYKSTLAATDIPTLAISKISGLQDALDAKQGTISDLSTIRTRANEGHTAYGYFSNGKLPWESLSNIPSDLVYDADYVHTDNNFTTAYKTLLDYFGYDATNHAVYLKDITVGGKKLSFYAYGELTAGGVGSGSGGGGLIEEVYGYSDLGGTYSDSDKTNTFNAYTTARLAARITALEGSATAVSYTPAVTSGTALGTITIDNVGHTIYAPTGVTSLGGQSGAITVRGGQTAPGSVNLAMSGTQLQASIVGLATVATSGAYGDLSGRPTALSQFTNDSGFITASALSGYATQGWVEGKNYLPTEKTGLANFLLWNDSEIGFQEWTPSTLNKPDNYGTSLNFRDETSWYYRLAFSTNDRIFYYRGINTTTMNQVGALAYLSDLDSYQPLATAINTSNIGSQSVAYAASVGGYIYNSWFEGDFNDLIGDALYAGKAYNATHAPYNYYAYLSFGASDYHTQLNGWSSRLSFRGKDSAGWSDWYEIIHSGNIASQSVAYASNAAALDGYGKDLFIWEDSSRSLQASSVLQKNICGFGYATNGWPVNGSFISFGGFGEHQYATQIQGDAYYARLFFRTINQDTGASVASPWKEIIHSGNISSQSVAYASSIASHTLWGQTFNGTQDISGGLNGVTSINGRQITWNQLISDGENELTATPSNLGELSYRHLFSLTLNHKYYISFDIKEAPGTSYGSIWVGLAQGAAFYGQGADILTLSTSYERKAFIFTNWDGRNNHFVIYPYGISSGAVYYKNLFCIDLTQMFGAGNEPTSVEQFRAMFPADYYPYSAGITTSSPLYHGGILTDGPITGVSGTLDITSEVRITNGTHTFFVRPHSEGIDFGSLAGNLAPHYITDFTIYQGTPGYGQYAFRIDQYKNIGIGVFSPSEKLHVAGNILATGEVTAGSDRRWKDNINPIAHNPIMALLPCEWDWKEGHGNGHSAGLIAQQVAEYLPFAVKGNETDGYTLNYNVFHAYEIAALQSHETRIEALERRVAELEKRLNIN